jgi:acetyltransferase-like isoleucine patch superfamily enzyme
MILNLKKFIIKVLGLRENNFHPLVLINGDPDIGENVYIGALSEINSKGARVSIGRDSDIASFVSINVADSHKRCIDIQDNIERRDIIIGNNVFIGSHSVIKGGAIIGSYSVIASGTIVDAGTIPAYSLVYGNPMQIKVGYYEKDNSTQ